MLTIDIPADMEEALAKSLIGTAKKLPREIAVVVNKTTAQSITMMSKDIRAEVAVKAKPVKSSLKKGTRASKSKLGSSITLFKTDRLSLKEFGARQVKRGTSYRISKQGGRKLARHAFMGPKPGVKAAKLRGHVFARTGRGRTPITRLDGVSPWGVFVKNNMTPKTVAKTNVIFRKQLTRRINFNLLKKQGLI